MWGKGLKNTAVVLGMTFALVGCQSLSQPSPDSSSILQIARWGRTEPPAETKPAPETPVPASPVENKEPAGALPMTDAVNDMVRDLLASLNTAQMTDEPCILVDPASFPSEGLTPETVEDLIGRLRIEMNRASNGNVYFVSPVQVEIQKAKGRSGYQYRLNGRFSPLGASAGSTRPRHQLDLQLQDAGGASIWSGTCSFAQE
jgi:hypothetical protein